MIWYGLYGSCTLWIKHIWPCALCIIHSWLLCSLCYALLRSIDYVLLTPMLYVVCSSDHCALYIMHFWFLFSVSYVLLTHGFCALCSPDSCALFITHYCPLCSVQLCTLDSCAAWIMHSWALSVIYSSSLCPMYYACTHDTLATHSWPLHYVHYTLLTSTWWALHTPLVCALHNSCSCALGILHSWPQHTVRYALLIPVLCALHTLDPVLCALCITNPCHLDCMWHIPEPSTCYAYCATVASCSVFSDYVIEVLHQCFVYRKTYVLEEFHFYQLSL